MKIVRENQEGNKGRSLNKEDPAISTNSIGPAVRQGVPSERRRHDDLRFGLLPLSLSADFSQGVQIKPTARAAEFLKGKKTQLHQDHLSQFVAG